MSTARQLSGPRNIAIAVALSMTGCEKSETNSSLTIDQSKTSGQWQSVEYSNLESLHALRMPEMEPQLEMFSIDLDSEQKATYKHLVTTTPQTTSPFDNEFRDCAISQQTAGFTLAPPSSANLRQLSASTELDKLSQKVHKQREEAVKRKNSRVLTESSTTTAHSDDRRPKAALDYSNEPLSAQPQRDHNTLDFEIRKLAQQRVVSIVMPSNGSMHIEDSILFINGINTNRDDFLEACRNLANAYSRPLVGVHNTTHGLLRDIAHASISQNGDLPHADRTVVQSLVSALMIYIKHSNNLVRPLIAHSEGALLLRFALEKLHAQSYSDLTTQQFAAFVGKHFNITTYGAPIKGTPLAKVEDRMISGDLITATRVFDQASSGETMKQNLLESDSEDNIIERHAIKNYASKLSKFEAQSLLAQAQGDGLKLARDFATAVELGKQRYESASKVLEEMLSLLDSRANSRERNEFCSEMLKLAKGGWIGAYKIPEELLASMRTSQY